MTRGEINVLRETTQSGARTALTIRSGQAKVYPEDLAPLRAWRPGPGQEVSWVDGQDPAAVRPVRAANAFAWESHRLAYDKAPLSEVVADLNRYVARPIRIADPALGALAYSGTLNLEGEDVMLRKIGAVLPVEGKAKPAEIVLQRAQPKPVKPPKPKRTPLVQSLLKLGAPPKPVKTAPGQARARRKRLKRRPDRRNRPRPGDRVRPGSGTEDQRSSQCPASCLSSPFPWLLVAASAARAQAISPQTTDWIAKAAATDAFEREAGALAQKRSGNADIRDFGAMMVKDHTMTTDKLRQVLLKDHPPVPGRALRPIPTRPR